MSASYLEDRCERFRERAEEAEAHVARLTAMLPKVDDLEEQNRTLLAACKAMSACCGSADIWAGETEAALRLIEAAIAKAEGRS